MTYWGGQVLQTEEEGPKIQESSKRKRLVWCFALLGLLPLLVFKYYNFLNDSLSAGLAAIGLKFAMPGLNWAVPVGISFFTFQAVGYMLDVYHGRVKPERSILDYVLFVSFFPQILSGPISKADELLPQIRATHKFDYNQGRQGLRLLLWGLFMKVVVADRLGIYVDLAFPNYQFISGANCFMASVMYTFQIYGDFAGYSYMAIGIGKLLGFNLINNFNRPYLAVSITDFWRRWHISLTRWLTQQVYIPLGGSHCSKVKNYRNIMITFLVSGIWHGANWTFIFWGVMHGVLQVVEKAMGWQKYEGKKWAVRMIRIVVTFLLVNFAWVFFRMPRIGDAFSFIGKIFTSPGNLNILGIGTTHLAILAISVPILVFKELWQEFYPKKLVFINMPVCRWAIYVTLFVLVLGFGVLDGGQFIYVSF